MKHKIWYSIQNGGDGSAYPMFMESKALCEIDQKYMDEGWGEPCVGCLTVISSATIEIPELVTVDMVIQEVEEELNSDYMKEYKSQGQYPGWFKRLEGKLREAKALKGTK